MQFETALNSNPLFSHPSGEIEVTIPLSCAGLFLWRPRVTVESAAGEFPSLAMNKMRINNNVRFLTEFQQQVPRIYVKLGLYLSSKMINFIKHLNYRSISHPEASPGAANHDFEEIPPSCGCRQTKQHVNWKSYKHLTIRGTYIRHPFVSSANSISVLVEYLACWTTWFSFLKGYWFFGLLKEGNDQKKCLY